MPPPHWLPMLQRLPAAIEAHTTVIGCWLHTATIMLAATLLVEGWLLPRTGCAHGCGYYIYSYTWRVTLAMALHGYWLLSLLILLLLHWHGVAYEGVVTSYAQGHYTGCHAAAGAAAAGVKAGKNTQLVTVATHAGAAVVTLEGWLPLRLLPPYVTLAIIEAHNTHMRWLRQ